MGRSLGAVVGSIGALLLVVVLFSSCRIIEDGEVGIVRSFGEIVDEPLETGVYLSIPLARSIEVWNTKLREVKETADVPSSEGLIVQMDVSVLWRIHSAKAPDLRQSISGSIEDALVTPYIRNGIRDVASGYAVKAVYTTEGRREIAATLLGYLQAQLGNRGVEIEDVILRDLKLPPTFKQSIEAKLAAEQRALQKEFELQQARTKSGHAHDIRASKTLIQGVVDRRQGVLVRNDPDDSLFGASESLIMNRVFSAICAPLMAGDDLLGILQVETLRPILSALGAPPRRRRLSTPH